MPVACLLEPEALVLPPDAELRIIVTGSREWVHWRLLCSELDELRIYELHHGDNPRGADRMSQRWAISRGIPFQPHPANWTTFGKAAGPIRNVEMLETAKPDAVIAFKDGFDHARNARGGTEHMVRIARAANVPVRLVGDGEARWL